MDCEIYTLEELEEVPERVGFIEDDDMYIFRRFYKDNLIDLPMLELCE